MVAVFLKFRYLKFEMNMSEPTVYQFSFQYELFGNMSDFNEVYRIVAKDFKFIHWLNEKTNIQSLRNCIIRKKKGQNYQLLKHQERDLGLELKKAQQEQYLQEIRNSNYQMAQVDQAAEKKRKHLFQTDIDLNQVIKLINGQFRDYIPNDEALQFLAIQQLSMRSPPQADKTQTSQKVTEKTEAKGSKLFYSILLHRPNQNRQETVNQQVKVKNLVISLAPNKCYEYDITMKASINDLEPSVKEVYKFQQKQYGVKVLMIKFRVQDKHHFFKEELEIEENPFREVLQCYDDFFPPGKFKLLYREDLKIRKIQFDQKHYSLAFQGGGAKGLAYVGAYQALKQNQISYYEQGRKKKKSVPISSIMGSSAGGMISLAVSTGISHRELQKICFKMKDIPKNDSFRKKQTNEQEEKEQAEHKRKDRTEKKEEHGTKKHKGEQPTEEQVFESIKNVLKQYGVLTQQSFYAVKETVTDILGKIMKPLLSYLSVNMPSIGDILRNQDDTLNLYGLLVKGALMKGDAVHNIGVQCLIKYFLKIYYQNKKEKLGPLLDDCFALFRSEKINQKGFNDDNISGEVMQCLQSYHSIAREILNTSIQIVKSYKNSGQFFVSFINTLILVIVDNQQSQLKKMNEPKQKDIMKQLYKSFKLSTLKKVIEIKQSYLKQAKISDLQAKLPQNPSLWHIISYINQTKQINSSNQYQYLKLKSAENNLLDSKIFEKSSVKCELTLKQFVQELLGEDYKKYFDNIEYLEHVETDFHLEGVKVSKFELQLAQIVAESFEIVNKKQNSPQSVLKFNQNKGRFADTVKNITMIQYYMLTNVELTCTSVDLDDKILRLFNKKTTPFLPVCKAVQMSGSFPAAFKAQKWKKQWGKYNIYYKSYKAEINLTGHEFTDGGLLANFPIRYLNNEDLCKKYLSHIPNSKTFMLGFGLDFITQDNYYPNMKEIYQKQKEFDKINEVSQEFTFAKMTESIGSFNLAKTMSKIGTKFIKSAIGSLKKQQVENIDWSDLNHDVLQQVPLIRFLLKLLDAYPNSDRNFNVETFSNRVLHQNIYQRWKNKYQLFEREGTEINLAVMKLKNILKKMKKNEYSPTKNMKEKPLAEYVDPQPQFQEVVLKKCWDREKELRGRVQIKKHVLSRMLNNNHSLVKNDPWFEKYGDQNIQREMVKKLIIILMMLIRQAPEKIRKQLTRQYLQLKHSQIQIQNPLEYDVGESLKRMVQYIYLKLVTKDLSKQQKQAIIRKLTQHSYEQILQVLQKHSKEQQEIRKKFNYTNVKAQFSAIVHRIILSPCFKSLRNGKYEPFWNENFTTFLEKVIKGSENSNAYLYCQQSFKESLFVKNQNSISKEQYQKFRTIMSNRQSKQYLTFMESQLFQYFKDNAQTTNLKNNFVNEAENVYRQNLETINQILLKQLSRRGMKFMTRLRKNTQDKEIQQILQNGYEYSLLKLIRAVTYYRQPQNGQERFTIKERKSIESAILIIFFGRNHRAYEKFQTYLNELQDRTKGYFTQCQNFVTKMLEENKEQVKKNQKYLECYFLRFLQRTVLTFVIANKIAVLNREQEKYVADDAREMLRKYNDFTENFKYIINCIKQCTVVLSELSSNSETKILENHYQFNTSKPQNSIKIAYKYQQMLRTCEKTVFSILQQFNEQSSVLSIRPNNTINMTHLQQIFMIRYQLVKTLISKIYSPLKYRYLQLELQKKTKEDCAQLRLISYILTIINKLTYHKHSIPQFEIDWKLTLKSQIILKVKDQKIIPVQSAFAQQIKFIVLHQKDGKFLQQKQKDKKLPKFHLILQGVSSSNQYYCTILALARESFMREFGMQSKSLNDSITADQPIHNLQNSKNDQASFHQNDPNLRMIEAVTCSNFHVMFGFLLSTNATLDKVKRELYHLKRIAQECEEEKRIQKYFSSYQWLNQCTNQYKQLLGYLQKERSQFFTQFQNLKERNFSDDSLHSQYQYMKSYFKNETQSFVENYDKILQQISAQVEIVDGRYKPIKKPRQICKRFAFDFMEQFQDKISYGKYSNINKQVFEKLKSIVLVIYDTFGTLVEGVFCTIVAKYGAITINDSNAKYITKGIVIKKLLSTFQLKEYITNKLQALHLSPSITLSKFYDSAPRPVFLNFCAINMKEERLQFLNKTTMPFMPVWAAILASTALPFLYNYFTARQQWYGVEQRSTFYSLIVQQFFKVNNKKNQLVNYCSSNYISSLPLQIMTNKAVLKKLGSKKEKNQEKAGEFNKKRSTQNTSIDQLQQFALAFSDKFQDGFRSLKVKRKYLNLRSLVPFVGKSMLWKVKNLSFQKLLFWKKKKEPQSAPNYWKNYLDSIAKIGNVANTFSTLVNSNDNFVLQWYHDRLIKLPIKLGTLDFHLIVDQESFQKYKIKVLSQKAKQTVQRSYEITKKFTSYITQKGSQRQQNRFKIKMRFEMVYRKSPYNFVDKYAKLTILNHSKWNQNRFNNFIVYYRIVHIRSFTEDFKKAADSEIIWNIETGCKIEIKFYFPYYPIYIPEKNSQPPQKRKPSFLPRSTSIAQSDTSSILQPKIELKNQPQGSLKESCFYRKKSDNDEEQFLAKVYYTRWQFDFRNVLDQIYCEKSAVRPADTFEFEFDYLNGHRDYDQQVFNITPTIKKKNIFYHQFTYPTISLENLSFHEQRKQNAKEQTSTNLKEVLVQGDNTGKVNQLDKVKLRDSKTDSVYVSEWPYSFS